MLTKFRDLQVGDVFTFNTEWFTEVCTKTSARCYTYGNDFEAQVGSINVKVIKEGNSHA